VGIIFFAVLKTSHSLALLFLKCCPALTNHFGGKAIRSLAAPRTEGNTVLYELPCSGN